MPRNLPLMEAIVLGNGLTAVCTKMDYLLDEEFNWLVKVVEEQKKKRGIPVVEKKIKKKRRTIT